MARSPEERPSRVFRKTKRFRAETRALGLRVRQLRQERDWTLEQAAEESGLDLKHYQKIEAGQLNVTLVSLVRIAEGFQLPMSSLFPARRKKN